MEKEEATVENNKTEGLDNIESCIDSIKGLSPKQREEQLRSQLFPLLVELNPLRFEHYITFIKEQFEWNSRWTEALRREFKYYRDRLEEQKAFESIETSESYEITDEEVEEAIEYLKSTEIITRIREDITKIGIVGEDINKVALYLIMLTRKFKNPIHAVVFGDSSAGKSHLVNTVGELVPPEDRVILTSGSARSLDYLNSSFIQKKVFIVQEIHGLKEIEDNIRIMQSEGKLTRLYPVFNPRTQRQESVKSEVICQASIITTTTLGGVHPENSTRIFEIHLDESDEQTKRIIELKKGKVALPEGQENMESERIKKLHHNIQRVLENVEVLIPFSKHIDFPSSTVQNRRDVERFLNLIKAVTFLRQFQKERIMAGEIEYIEACIEDYRIAHELGYEMLKSSFSSLKEDEMRVLKVLVSMHKKGKCTDIYLGNIEKEAEEMKIHLPQEPRFKEIFGSFIKKGFIVPSGQGYGGKTPLYTITLYDSESYGYLDEISEVINPQNLEQKIKESENGK